LRTRIFRSPTRRLALAALVALAVCGVGLASARSLEAIERRGMLSLCAHPNALPFASKKGEPPGFQVELAAAIAERLGVSLEPQWVTSKVQYRRAGCDIVLDAITEREVLAEIGLRPSRPYHRSGIALAVRGDSDVTSLEGLAGSRRIGVQVGSVVAMLLGQRGLQTTPFTFEDEMLDALAQRQIEAAAVTPAAIGWFNVTHAGAPVRLVAAFADQPELNWNVAVGMIRPDDGLRQSIDAALTGLLNDGTIARIYARYGVELLAPR
jgi:polar amino acid transport system substrate-binding protein